MSSFFDLGNLSQVQQLQFLISLAYETTSSEIMMLLVESDIPAVWYSLVANIHIPQTIKIKLCKKQKMVNNPWLGTLLKMHGWSNCA
jgi:hypothetical protein